MPEQAPDRADPPPVEPASAQDRSVLERPARYPHATWAYGADPDQVADVYRPAQPPTSVVLLLHGGYWRPEYDRAHLRPMSSALAARGHLVVSAEYRRRPGDPDVTASDVVAAWDALPSAIDGHADAGLPVVVVGHSAGGQLALWLAGRTAVPCLALAPVADLARADALDLDGGAVREFLGGPASGRPDLDPARRPEPSAPVTILHGHADEQVPVDLSRRYAAAMPGVRLVELPEAGHFSLIDPWSPAWGAVTAALDGLTANPSAAATAGIE